MAGRYGPQTLLLALCACTAALGVGAWSDFHFYATGARQLTSPDALNLLSDHPEVQIGPLALLVIRVLLPFGDTAAQVLLQVIGTGLALVPLHALQRLTPHRRALHWTAAATIGLSWTQISVHVQPADAFALAALAAAVLAVAADRAGTAAVCIVVAAGCKPWAAPAALLLLGLSSRKAAGFALALSALVVAGLYVPFLLQPGASAAIRPHIVVQPDAPVGWLLATWHSAPAALRPIQLIACAALAGMLGLSGRWRAVPVGVITMRLLLDPGALPYYHAGLMAMAVLARTRPALLLSLASAWFLVASSLYDLTTPGFSRALQLALGLALLNALRGEL